MRPHRPPPGANEGTLQYQGRRPEGEPYFKSEPREH